MKKWYLFVAIAIALSFNGCKKDDTQGEITATKLKLIEKLDKLDVPAKMKNSTYEYAKTAVDYVDGVKDIANYFSYFDIPEDAQREGLKSTQGDVYYWTYGGVSEWETYTEEGTKYVWKIEIDFGDGKGRHVYLRSEEEKDGSHGLMEIYGYENDIDKVLWTYEWNFDSKGNIIMTWKDTAETFKYEVNSNVDLSGYAKWFANGILFYHFQWNSDGSGSYHMYGDDGSEFMSESWTVADL